MCLLVVDGGALSLMGCRCVSDYGCLFGAFIFVINTRIKLILKDSDDDV